MALVIARSEATKQSILSFRRKMDCFAEPVIGRRFAPTRWLAMTGRDWRKPNDNDQRHRRADRAQPRLCRFGAKLRRQALRRNPGAGLLLLQSRQVAGRPCRVSQAD